VGSTGSFCVLDRYVAEEERIIETLAGS
jgi:hypothetical protein